MGVRFNWWGAVPLFVLTIQPAEPQVAPPATQRLITRTIDDAERITLTGNTRREANSKNDRGRVPDSLPMDHLQIVLRLPNEKQADLDRFLSDVQDPKSPMYHTWLTPQEFKERFSPARKDIDAITTWLSSEGFRVNAVNPTAIDFSGNAGEVERAFKTEIHYFDVKGVKHVANMHDPQIPAALAPAVAGIVSLNDFKPRPLAAR